MAKRHRKILRDNIQGMTKPALRRLARRGGVKRISGTVYEETRSVLKVFLENVIRDAVIYTDHSRRRTVVDMDVVTALKRQGRTLYGFGYPDGSSASLSKRKTAQRTRVDKGTFPFLTTDGTYCVCTHSAGYYFNRHKTILDQIDIISHDERNKRPNGFKDISIEINGNPIRFSYESKRRYSSAGAYSMIWEHTFASPDHTSLVILEKDRQYRKERDQPDMSEIAKGCKGFIPSRLIGDSIFMPCAQGDLSNFCMPTDSGDKDDTQTLAFDTILDILKCMKKALICLYENHDQQFYLDLKSLNVVYQCYDEGKQMMVWIADLEAINPNKEGTYDATYFHPVLEFQTIDSLNKGGVDIEEIRRKLPEQNKLSEIEKADNLTPVIMILYSFQLTLMVLSLMKASIKVDKVNPYRTISTYGMTNDLKLYSKKLEYQQMSKTAQRKKFLEEMRAYYKFYQFKILAKKEKRFEQFYDILNEVHTNMNVLIDDPFDFSKWGQALKLWQGTGGTFARVYDYLARQGFSEPPADTGSDSD